MVANYFKCSVCLLGRKSKLWQRHVCRSVKPGESIQIEYGIAVNSVAVPVDIYGVLVYAVYVSVN